ARGSFAVAEGTVPAAQECNTAEDYRLLRGYCWDRFARSSMKIFYGWVIVGAGIVITCLGMGTMMSLGIFLQPMSAATGWSRTSISTAALLNFLCMGPASFVWGASPTGTGRGPSCSRAARCWAS